MNAVCMQYDDWSLPVWLPGLEQDPAVLACGPRHRLP